VTTTLDNQPLDFLIVGQGIAGTTLVWQLKWRGLRGLVIDRDDDESASSVAAGLMTPVTGKRLVPAWRLEECWSAAESFYRRVEVETGSHFFTQPGQVRLFDSPETRNDFDRRDWEEHPVEMSPPQPPVNKDWFVAPFGGFELPAAGRLAVPAYLAASRQAFEADDSFRTADLDAGSDVEITASGVHLPSLSVHARQIIFCQGFGTAVNPWFENVVFEPARGEILTLRIDGLAETRIVNRGVWLAPCGGGLFKAGSTYDLTNLSTGPTEAGREEICRRLREFLKLPFEVVDHASGVRPIVSGRQPIIGLHPDHPQIGIFNGLGSKGSLLAPFVAGQFADCLTDDASIDAELDVRKRFPNRSPTEPPPRVPRLTEQAHEIIRSTIEPGETVIDATAGNGHDTCFLARLVGTQGSVFAFDVQADAIHRTADRLVKETLTNATVLQRDHAEMKQAIPEQHHGRIAAVMFNLGYLPGGDRSIITESHSSLAAIRTSLSLIRPGGVVTVLAYPGHSGGNDETESVQRLIEELPAAEFETSVRRSATASETAPLLFVIVRC
jgi:glycine/D-amino acid oxidase-like deaminating enzyme